MKYAKVLLKLPFDAVYSYIIPPELEEKAVKGVRVMVPYGSQPKKVGFVTEVSDVAPEGNYKLRTLLRVIDKQPVFNDELLRLSRWMSDIYFSPAGLNLSMMIPSGRKESTLSLFSSPGSFKPITTLSYYQEEALKELRTSSDKVFYLFGVTGSGKSEVYLRRAEDVISEGRQVLYLVPEITLTEQLSEEVLSRFQGKAAIFHSALTPSQRLKVWLSVMSGETKLLIGARSAVFAPFKDLGLIILDEEHETSYKSSETPRYHARQIAQERSRANGAQLIMGSATPSLEAWRLMKERKLHRIDMPVRAGGGAFPEVRVVNLLRSKRNITPELEKEIRRALSEKKGVLLFLNRRGHSYGYVCQECGHVLTCPNCSVALTYHKSTGRLLCHTCGWSGPVSSVCPECGSYDLSPKGYGTENIEEEVRSLFPSARVARLDTDSVDGKREVVRDTLKAFEKGDLDILLGTQMIAKGLNFPLVSVVGVLNADSTLSVPDFRAAERTFDLLHQVTGRAGRYRDDGLVIIQTTRPSEDAVVCAATNDLETFYAKELEARRETGFPPYSRMLNLTLRGIDAAKVQKAASELEKAARDIAGESVEVFPATPCAVERKARYYRYNVLLRSRSAKALLAVGKELLTPYRAPSGLYLEIDTDPLSIM